MRKTKMSGKGMNFGIGLVLVAVIALGAVGFYYYKTYAKAEPESVSEEIGKAPLAEAEERHLEFIMQPCSEVDELFNCKADNSFKPGDKVYFLIDVQNLNAMQLEGINYYELRLEKQFKNIDDNFVLMSFEESPETIAKKASSSGLINVKIAKELITLRDDPKGNYEYEVRLKDKISSQEYSQKSEFRLE